MSVYERFFDYKTMIFVKNAQKSQFYRIIYDFLYYICSAKTKLKTKNYVSTVQIQ